MFLHFKGMQTYRLPVFNSIKTQYLYWKYKSLITSCFGTPLDKGIWSTSFDSWSWRQLQGHGPDQEQRSQSGNYEIQSFADLDQIYISPVSCVLFTSRSRRGWQRQGHDGRGKAEHGLKEINIKPYIVNCKYWIKVTHQKQTSIPPWAWFFVSIIIKAK